MTDHILRLTLGCVSEAERDALTGELQARMEGSYPGVDVSRSSDGRGTQDAGMILQAVLNAAAVVAVARGIAAWLQMRQGVEIKVECPDGTKVIAKTLTSATAQSVIEATLRACKGKTHMKNSKQAIPKRKPRKQPTKKPKK